MVPIDAGTFRSRLRELSRSEIAALVETLWEARGRDVEQDGDFVVAVDPETGGKEVLLPVPGRLTDRWLPPREPQRPEATTVVLGGARPPTWARDDDVRVVDPEELRQLLLYGVDAETRRTLLADVFDVDPADAREAGGDDARRSRRLSPGPDRSAAIAVVGFLVLIGMLAGAVAFGVGPLDGLTENDQATAGAEVTPETAIPDEVATPTPGGASYPPGVSADGVENPDALAAAHVTNLSGHTYTMVFEYREVGENHTGTIRETTEVVADTRYASRLDRTGTFVTDPANVTDPAVVRNAETFANGEIHYERVFTDDGVRYERRPVYAGRFPIHVGRAGGFVQRTLRATDTRLAGTFERSGVTFYRVRFSGDDRPAFEDVEGVAVIDEFGIVHLLRKQYRPADHPNVTVTVTLEYTDFRTTELTEPDWLSEVGNETETPADETDTPANETDG